MIMVAAFLVMAVVAFLLYNPILHALQRPYCQVNPRHLRLLRDCAPRRAFLADQDRRVRRLVLASPIIFWQFWRFITPGLRSAEKRYAVALRGGVHCLVPGGLRLRVLHLPRNALEFLKAIGGPELRPDLQPQPVPGPHPAHDGAVRDHLRVPRRCSCPWSSSASSRRKKCSGWWRWAVIGIALAAAIFTTELWTRSRCSPSLVPPDRLLLRFPSPSGRSSAVEPRPGRPRAARRLGGAARPHPERFVDAMPFRSTTSKSAPSTHSTPGAPCSWRHRPGRARPSSPPTRSRPRSEPGPRPSTPPRSRRSPTRSTPSSSPPTARPWSDCSPGTPPSGPTPQWWS